MTTNTDTTTTAVESDKLNAVKTPFIALVKPGDYPATVTDAAIKRNHNGKLHVALLADIGCRVIKHDMYLSTEASAANTAKQLKNAFGIASMKEVPSIIGQNCSLRIEHEEYNGRMQAKVRYVNPNGSTVAEDVDFDTIDKAFTAPEPAAKPTTASIEF